MDALKTMRVFAVAMVLAALSAGCGSDTPEALVESARHYIAKKDYQAAWIQLKNALQKQPDNAEGHHLVGVTLAEFGDHAGAEKEFRQAMRLGHPADVVYPGLSRAMVNLGQFKQVISELGAVSLKDAAAQAVVLSSIGEAHLALREREQAREAFAAALARQPGQPQARIGMARLLATEGDIPGATAAVDEILAQSANLTEALALRADLLAVQGKLPEATQALATLVNASPSNGQARFALVSLLIGTDKLEQAAAEVKAWQKALPRDVRSSYFEAQIALRRNDWRKARDASLQVLKIAPEHAPSLVVAGTAEFQLGAYASAEEHLRKVLARHPEQLYARNILIATYLRKGQPAKAEELLGAALKQAPKEPSVLRAAGEVSLANNRLAEAAGYFEQALAVEGNNVRVQTRLAQIRLARGETQRALDDLQSAASQDAGNYQADLALISAYANRREYDKALAAVANLEKKQPDNPLTHDLKGAVYLAKQDRAGAKASFEKALSLQSNYLPAARNLARLDLLEADPESARNRLAAIVAKEPNNDGALLALAQMQMATTTSTKEIAATLDRAVRANPDSVPARLAQIDFLGRTADARTALTAAQSASAALPDNPALLEALGLAQLRAGETHQAIATFNNMARVVPDSPGPWLRLAGAEFAAKRHDAAISALRRALAIRADLPEALLDVALVQVIAGRPDDALKEALAVQRARPKEAIGFSIEGDVLATQKKFRQAAAAYAEGLKRQPLGALLVKQQQMLRAAGSAADADALIAQWLKAHPKDPVVRFYVADAALRKKDYANAADNYRRILEVQPDNVAVLNNLAWTLGELKDPQALAYAKRAYAGAPTSPFAQDTLGWVMFTSGTDAKRGLALLRQAAAAAPKAPEIRMHFAKALIAAGEKAAAKGELEAVIRLSDKSPLKTEAEQLLAPL